MLTVDLAALLKRVDSFTNSLNVSTAALEIPNYCFFRRLLADWVNYLWQNCIALPKNYKGYSSSSKLRNLDGRSLTRCYWMEHNKLGWDQPLFFHRKCFTLLQANHIVNNFLNNGVSTWQYIRDFKEIVFAENYSPTFRDVLLSTANQAFSHGRFF